MKQRPTTTPLQRALEIAITAGALAVFSLPLATAAAQDEPVPPPPAATEDAAPDDDAQRGLAAQLGDPAAAPRPGAPSRTRPARASSAGGITAYLPVSPSSPSDLPGVAERLRIEGRDDEALDLMAEHLLEPHPVLSLDASRQLGLTLRNLQPPPHDDAAVVLGAIFVVAGGAGIFATSLIFVFDGVFSSREPEPYVVAFTAAGVSIAGGIISLIAGLVSRDTGPAGHYRSTSRLVQRALREDARHAQAADRGRR